MAVKDYPRFKPVGEDTLEYRSKTRKLKNKNCKKRKRAAYLLSQMLSGGAMSRAFAA